MAAAAVRAVLVIVLVQAMLLVVQLQVMLLVQRPPTSITMP